MTSYKVKRQLKLFTKEPYLENLQPRIFYTLRSELEKVSKVLIEWNERRMSEKMALNEIWKLLAPITLSIKREKKDGRKRGA